MFNDPQFVKLNFFAKHNPDEILDPTGNRKDTFEITVSVGEPYLTIRSSLKRHLLHRQMAIGSSESNNTEGFRKYQPGQYVNATTGWSREYWLSKSVVFSKKFDYSLVMPRTTTDPPLNSSA